MILWTIDAAVQSGRFERILVYTDDEEVASIARSAGLEVPFRRDAFVDDHSPASLATVHATRLAEAHWGTEFDLVVQLMANCPLRSASDISEALDEFEVHNRPFQISACRFGWLNPWWAAAVDQSGEPRFIFPDQVKQRSQDLPTLLCPTGAVWIARRDELIASETFYGQGLVLHEMSWTASVDIDEYADLEFATAVAKLIE